MLSPVVYVNTALKKLDQYISFCTSTGSTTAVNQYERLSVERFLNFKSRFILNDVELRKLLKFKSIKFEELEYG
jgi:hypothetical protein